MRITALAGGIGGARFLRGLLHAAGRPGDRRAHEVTVIGNTADDVTLHGLRVCPDLDTVMYTLGGGVHEEQGWGRTGETFAVAEELAAYGAQPQWFTLGDRDIATHVVRTRMLGLGYSLSQVTEALCARWQPGVRLLPMSDDPVETHVVIEDADAEGGERAVHFQEWWVRLHAASPARRILAVGIDQAKPAPGVLEAIRDADVVLLPPSNPVVSIGTILSVPGRARRDARHAGARRRRLADHRRRAGARAWPTRACRRSASRRRRPRWPACTRTSCAAGWSPRPTRAWRRRPASAWSARPLLMSDVGATAAIAGAALDLALELRG